MDNEKVKGVLAYIFGIIGGLIVLLMKDTERNTRYHAAQSITIFLAYYIIKIAYSFIPISIPFFSKMLSLVYFVAMIVGIIKVCNSADPEIPVIGSIAESIFKKQIEKVEE